MKNYENRTLNELRNTKLYKMIPREYNKSLLSKKELIALFRSFRPVFKQSKQKFVIMDYTLYDKNYTKLTTNQRKKVIHRAIQLKNGEYVYSFLFYMATVRYPDKKDYKLFLKDSLWTLHTYSQTVYWLKKFR